MNEKQKSLIISAHRHRIGFKFQLSTGSSTAFPLTIKRFLPWAIAVRHTLGRILLVRVKGRDSLGEIRLESQRYRNSRAANCAVISYLA
jgi:hypothetical protein